MTAPLPASYPGEWELDAPLVDGSGVHLRPIRPDDAPALRAFHAGLSEQSVYMRFFTPHPVLGDEELRRFTEVDYHDRLALVALMEGQLTAVARYDRLPGSRDAEAAFLVADAHRHRGIGALLLEHLAAYARKEGIERFVAETLSQNRPMLQVFAQSGFTETTARASEVVTVHLSLQPDANGRAAIEEREARAEAASMASLLRPSSVAVVGAGPGPGGCGPCRREEPTGDRLRGAGVPGEPEGGAGGSGGAANCSANHQWRSSNVCASM
ncbi:MAG: GNAT family N-acetyltransferase [Acidimicrobiales bacterium]